MKDVVDRAKIWVADFPRKQYLQFKALLQGRVIGNVRKNRLQGDVDSLQEAVLRLIDFAHPAFRDKTYDDETIEQDLARHESPRSRRGGEFIRMDGTSRPGARRAIVRLVKEVEWRMLKEAARTRVRGQQ